MNDRDLQAVIEACARHAWENERRVKELKQHGITSEVELHQHIEKTIDDEDTRAFRGRTQANQGHSDGREMYGGLQHYSEERGKEYLTIVILNSNRDDEGEFYGGTCYIRHPEEFDRLVEKEVDATGYVPNIVEGGRPALCELYPEIDKTPSFEVEQLNENISPYAEQGLPKTFEEYIGQCEITPPEKTQDKEQGLER